MSLEVSALKWVIHQGEALEVLRDMEAMSVDLVLTDPTYFLPARHYVSRAKWPRSMADISILEHFYRDVFAECRRITKPSSALAVFCDGQSYPVFYSLLYRHWDRLIDVVWDKQELGMGAGIRRQHEWILVCVPNGFDFGGWEPSVIQSRRIASQDRRHPAEKPVELLTRLVRLLLPRNGLVLDPFAGTASTGYAAEANGARFVGIELDPEYAAIARRRTEQQTPLLNREIPK